MNSYGTPSLADILGDRRRRRDLLKFLLHPLYYGQGVAVRVILRRIRFRFALAVIFFILLGYR